MIFFGGSARQERLDEAKLLVRAQIQAWRAEGRTWLWIKQQPAAQAYYGPLDGR